MPFFGGVLGISLAPFIRARPSLYRFVKPIADKYQDACGYRKMGLLGDDIIPDENPIVERALARLTDRQRYDRAFRLRTAVQCSVLHHDLPKDQWIKPEEDISYLRSHIRDIEKEDKERAYWESVTVKKKSAHA